MECIVLAGGRPGPSDALFVETRGGQKAALDLAGRPMIAWVLDALQGSRHVDRIILVGLDDDIPVHGLVTRVPDHGSLAENLYAGIARLSGTGPAAYCWSDIPLATPAMIDRFIDRVAEPGLDVNAGLVPRSRILDRYPGASDLWLRFAEGQFIAADFGLFHPRQAGRMRPHIAGLAPQRKSAWRQALAVGVPLLVRFASGRLTMPELERRLGARYGLRCRIHVVDDPELGLDVASPGHLALCRQALAGRRASP
jgi:GTP:adenosylcobinamide-phosphate guanylyltransferase